MENAIDAHNNITKKNTMKDNHMMTLLATLIDNTNVGIYVSDYHTCEIIFMNRKISDYVNETILIDDFLGKPCWEIINKDNNERCAFCPYLRLLDAQGNPTEPYAWELYVEKTDMWIRSVNQVIVEEGGRLLHMVTVYDITDTKKMQAQLERLAYRDRLLNLKNEIMLEQDIRQSGIKPSLIVFDITSLQRINDAHGRMVGDALLRAIKDWLIAQTMPGVELYRIGGDEFCLTMGNHEMEALHRFISAISQRFSEHWGVSYGGISLQLYCNVSLALIIGRCISDSEPLISLIGRTLTMAKTQKSVTIYDEVMDRTYKERINFELILKNCVHDTMMGFDVFFQPIVNPADGTWCGLEALCRWRHARYGDVPPNKFIAEAERLELIGAIGLWVLENAIIRCKTLGLDRRSLFILDINLSIIQFLDEKLELKILNILRQNDYPSEKLCLEITESTQFSFESHAMETIHKLKTHNIRVALDDFGTGYSNFHQIMDLPVDIVKIERAFVQDIEHNHFQQYLFRTMSELTHKANMKLIAEGVESATQMDILVRNGADYLQGYLFSKPLSFLDLKEMLVHFALNEV